MKKTDLHIRGTCALLMHSNRAVDPLDPLAKAMSAITSKRKKTEEDHENLARLDWTAGLYSNGNGPIVPTWNIFACIRDGAKLTRRGRDVSRAIIFEDESVPLLYDGPKDADKLYADERHRDRRPVRVGAKTVMRTRPIFPEWELKFSFNYDPEVFNDSDMMAVIEATGRYVGICDYRPRFGRFEVVS